LVPYVAFFFFGVGAFFRRNMASYGSQFVAPAVRRAAPAAPPTFRRRFGLALAEGQWAAALGTLRLRNVRPIAMPRHYADVARYLLGGALETVDAGVIPGGLPSNPGAGHGTVPRPDAARAYLDYLREGVLEDSVPSDPSLCATIVWGYARLGQPGLALDAAQEAHRRWRLSDRVRRHCFVEILRGLPATVPPPPPTTPPFAHPNVYREHARAAGVAWSMASQAAAALAPELATFVADAATGPKSLRPAQPDASTPTASPPPPADIAPLLAALSARCNGDRTDVRMAREGGPTTHASALQVLRNTLNELGGAGRWAEALACVEAHRTAGPSSFGGTVDSQALNLVLAAVPTAAKATESSADGTSPSATATSSSVSASKVILRAYRHWEFAADTFGPATPLTHALVVLHWLTAYGRGDATTTTSETHDCVEGEADAGLLGRSVAQLLHEVEAGASFDGLGPTRPMSRPPPMLDPATLAACDRALSELSHAVVATPACIPATIDATRVAAAASAEATRARWRRLDEVEADGAAMTHSPLGAGPRVGSGRSAEIAAKVAERVARWRSHAVTASANRSALERPSRSAYFGSASRYLFAPHTADDFFTRLRAAERAGAARGAAAFTRTASGVGSSMPTHEGENPTVALSNTSSCMTGAELFGTPRAAPIGAQDTASGYSYYGMGGQRIFRDGGIATPLSHRPRRMPRLHSPNRTWAQSTVHAQSKRASNYKWGKAV
jgi:hypothetical protein